MTAIGSYEAKIIRCPLCEGIGRIYWVHRSREENEGETFVPWEYRHLTPAEIQRADNNLLVFSTCHGCRGRGLVSVESLSTPA